MYGLFTNTIGAIGTTKNNCFSMFVSALVYVLSVISKLLNNIITFNVMSVRLT